MNGQGRWVTWDGTDVSDTTLWPRSFLCSYFFFPPHSFSVLLHSLCDSLPCLSPSRPAVPVKSLLRDTALTLNHSSLLSPCLSVQHQHTRTMVMYQPRRTDRKMHRSKSTTRRYCFCMFAMIYTRTAQNTELITYFLSA